jgi:hypothetical protein
MEYTYNYWGIFKNGTVINNYQLSELAQVPNVIYYVREGSSKLALINSDGSLNFLKIGNFQLMDISQDFKGNATVTFHEIPIDNIFKVRLKISGISFFLNELIPLMNSLNKYGSSQAYFDSVIKIS